MESNEKPRSTSRESLTHLYESAIEAERRTGERENTEEKAKRSLIVRIFSIFLGTIITVLGVILLVAPGPGILVLACGLGILALDVPFARRLLDVVLKRLPQDESGRLTKKTILIMIVTALAGVIFSVVATWIAFV